ncbi:lanosterol 14-alpha-demethylase [Pyrrhoderma noxium]|uniref:Lanosterol 14-alpha-demethylase n=1 Tax=Pyrrhoderma noxium TaxID=2282107 RepID=A0A286UPC2_9AGAM|nr:lanosterol 14-alpha-demethylase [Pyrrhoderma noxium]
MAALNGIRGCFGGGLPIVLILLNVLSQILIPKNPAHPPEVFHWLPIIGSAIEYGNDPIGFFTRCREKYGDIFTFTLLGRKMTVALGPRGNNFVTGGKLAHMNAEEAYTHLTTPCFGKDVVYDVPNAVFMEQKRFIKAGLSTDNFRAYMSMMEDEITRFLETDAAFRVYQFPDERDEWGQFHPLRTLGEITILTASRTLQGREVRASLDKTFAQRYSDLDGGFTPLNFLFPNLPLPSYKRRDRAQKAMSEFYVDLIRKRKESGVNEDENDVIAALMDQKYKNGEKLAEHQIAHIMIALLMAGQHTSASTGTWALLRIAENPEIGQALYKEQVENFGTGIEGQFRTMTYDEMRDLPILDAVIRETLRMHPPIHSIIRKVVSDTPVPPTLASSASSASASRKNDENAYFVPKGYYAVSSPAVSQVDPLVWKEARKWDPKRWLEKDGVADRAGRTYDDADGERVDYGFGAVSKGTESPYQPFGAGRHRCIGEQFAYLQLGMVISTLIRNMELRLDIPFPPNNYHSMITLPQDPCNISYRRRIFN